MQIAYSRYSKALSGRTPARDLPYPSSPRPPQRPQNSLQKPGARGLHNSALIRPLEELLVEKCSTFQGELYFSTPRVSRVRMVVVEGQSFQESLRKLEKVRESWKKDEHVPDFLPSQFCSHSILKGVTGIEMQYLDMC